MTLYPAPTVPTPDFWKVFGHSWFQYQTGPSGDQTGRSDALFRSSMDIEFGNWRNFAIGGARICSGSNPGGRAVSGWSAVANYLLPPAGRSGPYAPDGGGTLFAYGINDMGVYGGHLTNVQNSIADSFRACISRARASRLWAPTDSVFAYGAGFSTSASGNDLSTFGSTKLATTTTSATITMTLPADYKGEPVCLAFLKRPDTTGGTVTWSGTTGVSGTYYTGNGLPSGFLEHGWMVKRFTGLTSANAGQTIIGTVTQMDASGGVFFESAWLESLNPPPVIVLNIAKLTTAGYTNSTYATWRTGAGSSDATMDANVNTVNGLLASVVAEFDAMVQIADVDTAINKDATRTSDGIHPNEFGAGFVVDAIIAARNRMRQPASASQTISFNGPAPRAGALRMPRVASYYYAQDGIQAYTTYTPVVGHMFAMPFVITESREIFGTLGLVVTTVGTTASTIRWAVYDDVTWSGYPQRPINGLDPSSGGAFSVAITPAAESVRDSATLVSGFGWIADPGLYWLAVKVETVGTSQVWRAVTGNNPYMPDRPTTGVGTATYMGWQLTGQATGALYPNQFPSGATPASTVPLLQVKKTK